MYPASPCNGVKMSPVGWCTVIAIGILVFFSFLSRYRFFHPNFKKKTERELVYAKVNAERVRKHSIGISFLGPIVLLSAASFAVKQDERYILHCLLVFTAMAGLLNFIMFGHMIRYLSEELDRRDRKDIPPNT